MDKSATAATQVAAFMGSAAPGDFGGSGTIVTYGGPAEWSYRRFILHYAKLAGALPAVSTRSWYRLRNGRADAGALPRPPAYPFVTALKTARG